MQSFSACKYSLVLNLGISHLCLSSFLLGNLSVIITGTSGFFKIFLDILQLGLRPKLCLEAWMDVRVGFIIKVGCFQDCCDLFYLVQICQHFPIQLQAMTNSKWGRWILQLVAHVQ